jgi:hypothetical protein
MHITHSILLSCLSFLFSTTVSAGKPNGVKFKCSTPGYQLVPYVWDKSDVIGVPPTVGMYNERIAYCYEDGTMLVVQDCGPAGAQMDASTVGCGAMDVNEAPL